MSSKQMMISTITMAVGDADGDWKAAEDILGFHTSDFFLSAATITFSRELCGLRSPGENANFAGKKGEFWQISCTFYITSNETGTNFQ